MNLELSFCGVNFKNPIVGASGTYGFGEEIDKFYPVGEVGGISTKGLTLKPRLGNPPPRIAETSAGMLNSVGLQNPGIDYFIKEILPRIKDKGTNIIPNVAASCEDEYMTMVEKLIGIKEIPMIEVNISCPNVHEGGIPFGSKPEVVESITKKVKKVSDKPIIMKLSPNVADIRDAAKAAENGGADGISLINTLTGMAIDPIKRKPILKNVVGGLSGACIKPVALRMVYQASKAISIPIMGIGGIETGRDVIEFMLCGASLVQVGTANLYDPYACQNIIEEVKQFMKEQNIDDIKSIIGKLED